jgi:glycyl-tRNA synthetase
MGGRLKTIVEMCQRRGIFFPSGAIYGGLPGLFDYGPIGTEIKNNLKRTWWRSIVHGREDVEGLDAAILTHPKVHHYSGFLDAAYEEFTIFRTTIGHPGTEQSEIHLRPATAQQAYANFANVMAVADRRLPFGIAQIGKAFRNETEPSDFLYRMREFEQMELQYFVKPGEDGAAHEQWLEARLQWWRDQGLRDADLRVIDVPPEELAHYSKRTLDIYFNFPDYGWAEIEGIANRTDFDCASHSAGQERLNYTAKVKANPESLAVMALPDPSGDGLVVPFVIEPASGVDRGTMAIICQAFRQETLPDGRLRTVLGLKSHLAPFAAAVVVGESAETGPAIAIKHRLLNAMPANVALETNLSWAEACEKHDEIGTPVIVLPSAASATEGKILVRRRDCGTEQHVDLADLIPAFTAGLSAADGKA